MTRQDHGPSAHGGLSDHELVRRVQAGDPGAFEPLFERYVAVLEAWIARRMPRGLGRKVSAADLLQETRIAALIRLPAFEDRGPGACRAWLLQITRHKLRDAVRRYRGTARRGAVREISRGARPDTACAATSQASPSDAASASEERRRLRSALAQLPRDYREVLRMARLEELPLREVAERMGRSREAVKKLYGRALSRFTELYRATEGVANDG